MGILRGREERDYRDRARGEEPARGPGLGGQGMNRVAAGGPPPRGRAVAVVPRAFEPVVLDAPPSKAASLRAIFLAAIARRASVLRGVLDCEDTRAMRNALHAWGAVLRVGPRDDRPGLTLEVTPRPDRFAGETDRVLHAGESGVTARFLLALAAVGPGATTIRASASLRRRPVGPLVAALRRLGARADSLGREGFLPVRVRGPIRRGAVRIASGGSSQYASALAAIAGLLPGGLRLTLEGRPVSRPYLALTCRMLRARGVRAALGERGVVVPPGRPRGVRTTIGADPSAAAFGWAAGALARRGVLVRGRFEGAEAEGDLVFLAWLRGAGCRVRRRCGGFEVSGPATRGLRVNLRDHPDLAPPLAVVLGHAPEPSCLTGLAHLRAKESDRVASLAGEWRRLGFGVRAGATWLAFRGGGSSRIRTGQAPTAYARGDHRLVMALSMVGLVPHSGGVRIRGAHHVAKTAPGFFGWIAPLARVRRIP